MLLSNKNIPAGSPISLNTTDFKDALPALYQKYPNSLMQIQLTALNYPKIILWTGGVNGTLLYNVDFYVIPQNNTTPFDAFTVQTVVTLDVNVWIKNNSIQGNVLGASLNSTIVKTNIGPFDIQGLNGVLQFAYMAVVIGEIQQTLTKGYPMPVLPDVRLVNPQLVHSNGYMSLLSDFNYSMQSKKPTAK